MESNHRPQRYQHCALPLSYAAIVRYRESNANILLWTCSSPCVMEEEVGFEPTDPREPTVFKTVVIDLSTTLP